MVAAPIVEAETPPRLLPIFEQIRASMRAPLTPALFRTLARWPAYVEHVWPQLQPSVETAGFRGSAHYLAAMAREAVDQFYDATYDRDDLIADGMTGNDLEAVAGTLEVLHLTNPQTLLLAAALTEALERPSVGGQGRPDEREATEEEARISGYRWTMADDRDLSGDLRATVDDIREVLRLPFLTDDFRAYARWPALLSRAWPELRELRVFKLFRQRARGLYYYSRSSSRFLARPLVADPPALRGAGLDDDAIAGIAEVLRMFCGILPNHMMNTATIQSALGIRPELPPPPPPRAP